MMPTIDACLRAFDHYLTGIPEAFPWFIALLLGTGIFITLRLGFVQIRRFGHAVQVVSGVYDDPEDHGDVTHFQALTVPLSATVGVGNIAGVALAIHYGGPGAVFWMWVTAALGMAVKFTECTLALKYRVFDENGEVSGGPMYYIEKGLGLKWAAVFFAGCAVICSFATGNMNQSNTIASIFSNSPVVRPWMVGLVTAFLVGIVIIGGVQRIARVTERLAPFMAVVYFLGAGAIVVMNLDRVPGVLVEIVQGALNPQSAFGGTAAGIFVFTLLHGVRRGIFSNEAGQGSAPIAHACARTEEPVREGVVALLEPFIDTLVICSPTAFAILLTGSWNTRYQQVFLPQELVVCSSLEQGSPVPVSGDLEVVDGRPTRWQFASNHASVEAPLVGVGGQLFSGRLHVEEGVLVNLPVGLRVEGAGLLSGAPLTAQAFRVGLGGLVENGDLIVHLSVILFALSTIISWSYYGDRSFVYLFGARYILVYRIVYLVFVFVGSVAALELVWLFGDVALSCMSIPNLLAILLLHREVVADTRRYFATEHVPHGARVR